MRISHKIITSSVIVLLLSGCAGQGPKQTGGGILGGIGGALIGSQFGGGTGKLVGVAIGALAGSYLGGSIGHQLDQKDKQIAQDNMNSSLENAPDNQVRAWRNPNNNHSGNFQVTRTQEMPADHMVCRDYVHSVLIDGEQEKVHGRACRDVRDSKGKWMVQE